MYGAQHDYILDDRDVDANNINRKFEHFAHLRHEIQKLIIYSTLETEQICGQLIPGHQET